MAAFLAAPNNAFAAEECPASLVLHVEGLSTADAGAAQRYATCVSLPWLPTANGRGAKLAECAKTRAAKAGQKLKSAFDWVDHIATQFPTCETRLKIKRNA